MMVRHLSSLATALSVSAALHTGAFVALDHVLGGIAGTDAGMATAQRPAQMFVSLSGPLADAPSLTAIQQPSAPTNSNSYAPGLLALPMPLYLPADGLDRKPEAIGEIPLAYPAELPHVKQSRVVLSLLIDEQGLVDRVIVEAADSPKELEEVASHAFAGARFTPGLRNGNQVKSRLRIEVTFEGD